MPTPQRPRGKAAAKPGRSRRTTSEDDVDATIAQESAAGSQKRHQVITDARAMRALAHPLRVALLETIRRDGPVTASQAAELLDESPGNMSWHLQTLAKYGFIEETGEGRGRSRPWRVTSDVYAFETATGDQDTAAAGEALERTFVERTFGQMREWWSSRLTYPTKWRQAAFVTNTVRYLTADELAAMMADLQEIYDRYADREDEKSRPAGALPVRLYAHGHPLAPTPSGN